MTDPWGAAEPPADTGPLAPLPPRLARLAEIEATGVPDTEVDLEAAGDVPDAAELPEVRDLMRAGWQPLQTAPLYCLLPAAWPREHRTWVRDRLPRVMIGGTTATYYGTIAPRPDDDGWDDWDDQADTARDVELPAPPRGRLWLLRSPWPRIPVAAIYEIVWSLVDQHRHDAAQQMYVIANDVLRWDEARALAALPSETCALLDAWAAHGRIGEAAAAMIDLELTPDDVATALDRTGLTEAALLDCLDSLGRNIEDEVLAFIVAWRAAGLPGDPPPGADRFLDRDLAELQAWLDAGFDLHAADRLELAGVDRAIRWRDAGFSTAETYELLRADPDLTTDEAHAFDDGAIRERRVDWIYYGFTAAAARWWSATGLTPGGARLWRACGLQPDDVRSGQQFPPQLVAGRRYIGVSRAPDGEVTNSEWDSIPDPPGTRGRRARRWAGGDPDPWIDTD